MLALVDRLLRGEAYEEKVLGAITLALSRRAKALATPAMVDAWLDHLTGWAEVDSLCASVFGADQMAADWPGWRDLIERLSGDANINKRRAALVLLVTPTRTSDDPRFSDLALQVIEERAAEGREADPDHQGGLVAAAFDDRAARTRGRRLSRRQRRLIAGDRGARDADEARQRNQVWPAVEDAGQTVLTRVAKRNGGGGPWEAWRRGQLPSAPSVTLRVTPPPHRFARR